MSLTRRRFTRSRCLFQVGTPEHGVSFPFGKDKEYQPPQRTDPSECPFHPSMTFGSGYKVSASFTIIPTTR